MAAGKWNFKKEFFSVGKFSRSEIEYLRDYRINLNEKYLWQYSRGYYLIFEAKFSYIYLFFLFSSTNELNITRSSLKTDILKIGFDKF